MGSTGEVRSRAWICGFSSTAKTAAFAGGARYRPTTSRILSISSGSGEILKSSARHGCSPNARQMRCTLDGEIPTRLASSRLDQCVAPSGTSSSVRTTTSSTWASLMVRGTPGRGSSPSPSSRLARKRVRHFLTVARLMPSRAATAILGPPSAQAKTIRARSASPCAVFRRFAQFSSVRRSASDSTSGSSLVSPMPPADRGPTASSPPSRDLKQNTTHVVMRKPKTGTLEVIGRGGGAEHGDGGRAGHGDRPGLGGGEGGPPFAYTGPVPGGAARVQAGQAAPPGGGAGGGQVRGGGGRVAHDRADRLASGQGERQLPRGHRVTADVADPAARPHGNAARAGRRPARRRGR